MTRDNRLCSVDKANVLQNSVLWRQTVVEVCQGIPRGRALPPLRG